MLQFTNPKFGIYNWEIFIFEYVAHINIKLDFDLVCLGFGLLIRITLRKYICTNLTLISKLRYNFRELHFGICSARCII